MAEPDIPDISAEEQKKLYEILNDYNRPRASYKEAGAYLVVFPRTTQSCYTLWVYADIAGKPSIFYLFDLHTSVYESLRMAGSLCFYSVRPLHLIRYNAKRMQSNGDDLASQGKYHGHYLHEIMRIDPPYLAWIAYKFTPRIPKQERFVQIARLYHSVYLDLQQHRRQTPPSGRFLGKEGETLKELTLTVTGVRTEDNPYKTHVRGNTPFFYVRQLLKLKDAAGNLVSMRITSRRASHESGVLPAGEHAYRQGETVRIASARVARTYTIGTARWTHLYYVKFKA